MIPLVSFTHYKQTLEATPRRLPRRLACCIPSLTAHMLHVKMFREDGFCDAPGLQDRDTYELYASKALSWKRHSPAVASKADLLRTQVSKLLVSTKSQGSPNSFMLRTSLIRYSGNPRTPQRLKSSSASETVQHK